MKRFITKILPQKAIALLLMAMIVVSAIPMAAFAASAADLKADGQDALTLATSTASFTITFTAPGATACQLTAPTGVGGLVDGASMVIAPGHPWYPALGGSSTFSVTCSDGSGGTATDSLVVTSAPGAPAPNPTVDVKANGSDGPITLNTGDSYTLTWTSANATACQMTPPVVSGISLSGTSVPIDASNTAFYPTISSPITVTVNCTNGTINTSDSVVINLAPPIVVGATTTPTVNVKANGSDGPVTLNPSDTYILTWTSSNATACQMTPPVVSGVSLSGTSVAIASGSPFFPTAGAPVTITITCTDGTTNGSDSVVVQLASGGGGGTPNPTVDVKANGSDGPITLNTGDSYTLTWTSANATACQMTPPVVSGISLSGTSVPIDASNTAFYPTISSPITVTVNCTNGTINTSDSVVINLAPPGIPNTGGGGGGGGGGSSSGGHRHDIGSVVAGTVGCPLIHDYMRIDFQNDPIELMKLQAFLKVFMGYDYVTINGVFDQATYIAVGAFQMQYKDDILTPWGHTAPTHYVYILTLKKVNELYCQHILPLTQDQQSEIVSFRNLINHAGQTGSGAYYKATVPSGSGGGTVESTTTVIPVTSTSTIPIEVPIVGSTDSQGQNYRSLAAALFTFPDNLKDTMQCFYEFVLILVVLYVLGAVLKDVLYSDLPENALKRFLAKWVTIVLGLLASIIIAYLLSQWCLVLPLLVMLIGSAIWMTLYPKHNSIRSSLKKTQQVTTSTTTSSTSNSPGQI